MKIVGKIYVPEGDKRTYGGTVLRPSALTEHGLADCEVVLENTAEKYGNSPVFAELHFHRVVTFSENIEEIQLFVGSKLVSIFEPLTLEDTNSRSKT